jgi:aspartate-semialdehyde dehydrogenase
VIPEVNRHALRTGSRVIANPNCTIAAITVPLGPLHRHAGLRRVVACSYQSVSGAGQRGIEQLWAETKEIAASGVPPAAAGGRAFAHPIAMNVIPAVGSFRGAHAGEEVKMAAELRKMLEAPGLSMGVTCVRVPTLRAHGVAVHAEFDRPLSPADARELLRRAAGVEVVDGPELGLYTTPLGAAGRHPCYVGRIRTDEAGLLAFFAVADNLLKGAALNAVQIAEAVVEDGLLVASRA